MEFSITDKIEYPIEQVFHAHRDCLEELVRYLPNVESIVVESRQEEDDVIHLVNLWKAARTEVPRVVRPFIKPGMLKWLDRATWHQKELKCVWELEFGFMKEAVSCKGENHFASSDEGYTEVTLNGELKVDARKIPGVPKFMANKVSKGVENFVIKMITPNLKKTNDGVRAYLAEKEQ